MTITALAGGMSGIGQAVAKKLAQLEIHVIVVGRSEERGKKTIAEIRRLANPIEASYDRCLGRTHMCLADIKAT
jgi:short-subunit dehydrogenase involved in D-alanine esterification of teichoic acids